MTVFRTLRFLPLAFIAEAVSKSLGYGVKCQPQKSQVTSGEVQRTCWNTASQFFQQDHRSEEHTSELQSRLHLVCRLLLEKKKKKNKQQRDTNNTNETCTGS